MIRERVLAYVVEVLADLDEDIEIDEARHDDPAYPAAEHSAAVRALRDYRDALADEKREWAV